MYAQPKPQSAEQQPKGETERDTVYGMHQQKKYVGVYANLHSGQKPKTNQNKTKDDCEECLCVWKGFFRFWVK